MNNILNQACRRPTAVTMLCAACLLAGLSALRTMTLDNLPHLEVPRLLVETRAPGLCASEVKTLITVPAEDALSPVKGLRRVSSVSRDGLSIVTLEFSWGTKLAAAAALVREAVDSLYTTLPESAEKPIVTAENTGEPAAVIAVLPRKTAAPQSARRFAGYELRARLRRIEGVSNLILSGGQEDEALITVNTPRLLQNGLSPAALAASLANETANTSAGSAVYGEGRELVVTTKARPLTLAELAAIPLSPLPISASAEVTKTAKRKESVFLYGKQSAAALYIYRQAAASPLKLSKDIKNAVSEAQKTFGEDFEITLVRDAGPQIADNLRSLALAALTGVLAVTLILLILLRSLRSALLAALAIPLSAGAGIASLAIAGASLNAMSIQGLALAAGLVTDTAVIMLDVLDRTFKNNTSPPHPNKTALAASGLCASNFGSALTTAIVFVPIIFLPGPLGSLFGPLSLALCAAVLASALYAQFALPSLWRFFWKKGDHAAETLRVSAGPGAGESGRSLAKTLRVSARCGKPEVSLRFPPDKGAECVNPTSVGSILHRKTVGFPPRQIPGAVVCAVLFILGIALLLTRPAAFLSPEAGSEIEAIVSFNPLTTLEEIERKAPDFTSACMQIPGVKTVYAQAGAEAPDINTHARETYRRADLHIHCLISTPPSPIITQIQEALSPAAGASGASFRVEIPADAALRALGLDKKTPPLDTKRPSIKIYPKRQAASALGVSASSLSEASLAATDGLPVSTLEIAGRPIDVRLRGQRNLVKSPADLARLPIAVTDTGVITLGEAAKISVEEESEAFFRRDRADITADCPPVETNVFKLYEKRLIFTLILAAALLYVLLGVQFESFLLPLLFMLTLPFALSGAGFSLFLLRGTLDFGSVLGLVTLFGVAVNSGIVLYERSEHLVKAGLPPRQAVKEASRQRQRSIFAATATTVIMLVPLAVTPGSQRSLSQTMLGGALSALFLTLFALPTVFEWYFCRVQRAEGQK